jgi:hypothetical protein
VVSPAAPPPYPPPVDVIELNTEFVPELPLLYAPAILPLPPPPTVTVIGEPDVTEKSVAVLYPPAPPAPEYPPPPPPATTRYSTVGVTAGVSPPMISHPPVIVTPEKVIAIVCFILYLECECY